MKKSNIKSKKTAFTVAEAVICFVIMGMIFAATLVNVIKNDNYHRLYWIAFDTLFQAAHNAQAEYEEKMENKCSIITDSQKFCYSRSRWDRNIRIERDSNGNIVNATTEKDREGGTIHGRSWPGYLYGNIEIPDNTDLNAYQWERLNFNGTGQTTDRDFCRLLTGQINTLYSLNECNSFIAFQENARVNNNTTGTDFLSAFGSGEIEPSFIAANGQKFYISSTTTANAMHEHFGLDVTKEKDDIVNEAYYKRDTYRFVVVDINGNAGPNTQFKRGERKPDLVLFALDSRGNVIPLGLPEFDQSYISAEVQYPDYLNEIDETTGMYVKNTLSKSETRMKLIDAKAQAWGQRASSGSAFLYNQGYSDNEPLSHSVKFYYNALNANNLSNAYNAGEFTVDNTAPTGPNFSHFEDNNSGLYASALYVHLIRQFVIKERGLTFTANGNNNDVVLNGLLTNSSALDSTHGCTSNHSKCKIIFDVK